MMAPHSQALKSLSLHIKELELQLLQADMRANPEILDSLLAADFMEIANTGKMTSREEVVNWLVNRPVNDSWVLNDFRLMPVTDDVVMVNYSVGKKVSKHDGKQTTKLSVDDKDWKNTQEEGDIACSGSIRSSLWRMNPAAEKKHWQLVFHQATKLHS